MLNVALDPDTGESEVHLVYGTTNLKLMERRDDFFVSNLAEMDACGLVKATRFDLDTMAWIPWASEWFSVLPGYGSPVIGHLTDHAVRLLQYELAWRSAKTQAALEQSNSE